jgi:guanine nucleotide-binding protein alpha-1 subunit
LIHSVNTILEALEAQLVSESDPDAATDSDNDSPSQPTSATTSHAPKASSSSTTSQPKVSEKHSLLKLRLAPLRRIETDLRRRLGASTSDDPDNVNGTSPQQMYATPFESPTVSNSRRRRTGGGEVVVRSWKSVLQAEEHIFSAARQRPSLSRGGNGRNGEDPKPDEATEVIASCKEDIKALWDDPAVKSVLLRSKKKLADSAGL